MKSFKKAVLGAALALGLSSAASATMINVGGVIWDPDAATDYSSQSINMRQFIDTNDGSLSGFGIITAWNGTAQSVFCPGCEVTFQFGGYKPIGGTIIPNVGQTVSYEQGWVKFYVGAAEITNPSDYLSLNWANTGNGSVFLDTVANASNGVSLIGTVNDDGLGGISGLSGIGRLDVVGGLAASNFNTNTQPNGSDLRFSTSLTYIYAEGDPTDASGTGNLRGNSIPEPGTLALLGMALLGAGLARRKSQA